MNSKADAAATLRILDANANRAREALRVIEDYARFALNDDQISGPLKQLRHDLADAMAGVLSDAILLRDTPGDVGTQTKAEDELSRDDVGHVVVAAGKRLGEALRAIEEYSKTIDPAIASRIEAIRYRFYDLEQRVALTIRSGKRFESVRLYVLITEKLCNRPWLEAAEQAILGGADCLQLREKDLDGGELLRRARQFVLLCQEHGVISIINDRPDIAILSGADGVHVGQDDLPATDVRRLLGNRKIVGVSTHNIEQAKQAVRDGADYIGVGPVFPSNTKPRDFLPGLDFARQVAQSNLPIPAIAIAGITHDNVETVLETGIRAIAVTSAVLCANDVRNAATSLRELLVGRTFLSVSPTAHAIGPTFLSVPSSASETSEHHSSSITRQDVMDVAIRRRHLPHWTAEGATYFLTFRVRRGELSSHERETVIEQIRFGDGRFYDLSAAVVMPDHVHILLRPNSNVPLVQIVKGIKGVTDRRINETRGTQGTVWQQEYSDRIVRDQPEFEEKLKYIVDNPVKRELADRPEDYAALYIKEIAAS